MLENNFEMPIHYFSCDLIAYFIYFCTKIIETVSNCALIIIIIIQCLSVCLNAMGVRIINPEGLLGSAPYHLEKAGFERTSQNSWTLDGASRVNV